MLKVYKEDIVRQKVQFTMNELNVPIKMDLSKCFYQKCNECYPRKKVYTEFAIWAFFLKSASPILQARLVSLVSSLLFHFSFLFTYISWPLMLPVVKEDFYHCNRKNPNLNETSDGRRNFLTTQRIKLE